MKTNQHIIKSTLLAITLVMGFVLSPIFAFSQQNEPTKTVNIVVTLQPKTIEKEIIQLPADNQPVVIHGAKTHLSKKAKAVNETYTAPKPITTKLKPAIAAQPAQKKEIPVVAGLKPVKKPVPVQTAVLKPQATVAKAAQLKQITAKPATTQSAPTVKATTEVVTAGNSLKPNAGNLKPSTTVSSNTTTAMVATQKAKVVAEDAIGNASDTNMQTVSSDKQNTISYVWIGAILIIAGVILGLLFGRTAFLVSFVGVIFILLGVFIF